MNEKIKKVAKKIKELEKNCQNDIDKKESLKEMEELMSQLSINELFELAAILEN